MMLLLPPSIDEADESWLQRFSYWEKKCGLTEEEKAKHLIDVLGNNSKLIHSLQDKFFDKFTIEQIMGRAVLERVKGFLKILTGHDINKALSRWNEFEKCITTPEMVEALINRFNAGLEKRIVESKLDLDTSRKDTLYKQTEAALREALSAGPGPGEGAKPAVAANVAVPQKEGVFLTGGRRHNLARKAVKRKKTGKDLKRKKQKICDLGPESRAPDSCDITKRKKDNLAERKQGDKAKVRSKVNNGAGKRRLGTPDSCNEEKARQKKERLNRNNRIWRSNAKLRAEKVKDSVIHMRKEREKIEERIKPLRHSMVYLKDTLFSHTGSNHEINFLPEQTSYIVEVNKPAPIIDTPNDVPGIEIEREEGKQYSKDELKKLRKSKAQKVRDHKKKVSRQNDQLELEKLQLQLRTLPLEEQQMKLAKQRIRAESARILNGSLTKEAWEEFIERAFARDRSCSLNASCNLSVKWPLDPRICEYVGVNYPEDLQSEVQVSSLSGQQASTSTKLSLQ